MSIVEKKPGKMEEVKDENGEQQKILYQVFPEISRRVEYKDFKVEVEISLPGVRKEDIILKALPTWFHITGRRGQMEYSANSAWGAEIVPEKTKAKYENGLLQILATIRNPMEDAKKLEL